MTRRKFKCTKANMREKLFLVYRAQAGDAGLTAAGGEETHSPMFKLTECLERTGLLGAGSSSDPRSELFRRFSTNQRLLLWCSHLPHNNG